MASRKKYIILPNRTSGPVETVSKYIAKEDSKNSVIICDCDHSINIDPIMKIVTKKNNIDCLIPIWDIEKKDMHAWSIISVADNRIVSISEKNIPENAEEYFGVIGCYYFRGLDEILEAYSKFKVENFSEIIKFLIDKGKEIRFCRINEAKFFGDPDRLVNALKK